MVASAVEQRHTVEGTLAEAEAEAGGSGRWVPALEEKRRRHRRRRRLHPVMRRLPTQRDHVPRALHIFRQSFVFGVASLVTLPSLLVSRALFVILFVD